MRVDFYLLAENKKPEYIITSLATKAYKQGWRIGIHVDNSEYANLLDDMLWSQTANSFMPHQIIKTTRCQSSEEAIMIFTHAPDDIDTLDYYINFTGKMIEYNKSNGRIADVVKFNDQAKTAGRERYSYYKQQSCELNHHEIV